MRLLEKAKLLVGLYGRSRNGARESEWLPIGTAPRDGTPIELKNSYGLMPTYSLSAWVESFGCFGWYHVNDSRTSTADGSHLEWRPYLGDPCAYIDPTNGAQNMPEYWDAAIAKSSGMSIRQLHSIREANRREREQFGDGTNAPYFDGHHRYNGRFTLYRGVWCNDAMPRPNDAELDRCREAAASASAPQDQEPTT